MFVNSLVEIYRDYLFIILIISLGVGVDKILSNQFENFRIYFDIGIFEIFWWGRGNIFQIFLIWIQLEDGQQVG